MNKYNCQPLNKQMLYGEYICYVLVAADLDTISKVLMRFLVEWNELNLDYTFPKNSPDYVFRDEAEMLSCALAGNAEGPLFFWKSKIPVNDIMVGADFFRDKQMVISLTFDGDAQRGCNLLNELKSFLKAEHAMLGTIPYWAGETEEEFRSLAYRQDKSEQ